MSTIICDLDGTIANIDHRLPLLQRKSYDEFWAASSEDTPYQWCVDLLHSLWVTGSDIIFVSGRSDICREATERWLIKNEIDFNGLYMRPEGDHRPDYEVKSDIFEAHLKHMDIAFVIEDRSQVVRMWRNKGLVVLQCDEGNF